MRRDLATATRALVLPTILLLVAFAFLPGRVELGVRIYVLLLCGSALAVAVAALRRAYPPAAPFPDAPVRASTRTVPPSLGRLEHVTALGVAGAFDLHHRLRPRLRSLALELAWARRRMSLDADPAASRAALGEETWELVRADRPPPQDRLARGIMPSELGRAVDALERL